MNAHSGRGRSYAYFLSFSLFPLGLLTFASTLRTFVSGYGIRLARHVCSARWCGRLILFTGFFANHN